jgi:capsular polysaccharide transport system permease protein
MDGRHALTRLSLVRIGTPAIRHARLSPRSLSFVALVVMPIVIAAAYYFAVAADQYIAEFRFTLNTVDPPRFDPLSLFTGSATRSPASSEAQVLVQYMTSRAIVDEVGGSLDLRRLFAPPQADWWARLQRPASIEELARYWQGQVDPSYDPATARSRSGFAALHRRMRCACRRQSSRLAKSSSTTCRCGRGATRWAMPKASWCKRKAASKRCSAISARFATARG